MSIFTRKKKQKKQKPAPKSSKQDVPETQKRKKGEQEAVKTKGVGSNLILFPLLTEKATDLQSENKYVFVVSSGANKSEVKKEVERLFGVRVEGVNILKAKSKQRTWRGIRGRRSGYKKAVVKIEEGKKIEILPA